MRIVAERREGGADDAFGKALVADRGDVIDAETALAFGDEHIFAALLQAVHPAAGILNDIGEFLERVRFARQLLVEHLADRKSVVQGKGVSVRVDLGGRRVIKKKNTRYTNNSQRTQSKKKK